MSQNWMRHFELQLIGKDGKGISFSNFKVTFYIEWADTRWPRFAKVKIYNLSANTSNGIMNRLEGVEYSKIRIIAGYDGIAPDVTADQVGVVRTIDPSQSGQRDGQNFGLIFEGDIRFTITGKDNPVDSWLLIQAVGEHEAFLYARVKTTLAAGHTVADIHSAAMKSFDPFGVTKGLTGDMPSTVFPRGLPLYQSTRKVMDSVAGMCNATWQMINGTVQMVPENKYISEAVVLNADTGLIGMPQQTMGNGINVRCLINPNICVNGLIQLDQASVYRAEFQNQDLSVDRTNEQEINGNLTTIKKVKNAKGDWVDAPPQSQPASIATDGVYIVKAIYYTGDTRGQDWYMDLMCFARGSADMISQGGG